MIDYEYSLTCENGSCRRCDTRAGYCHTCSSSSYFKYLPDIDPTCYTRSDPDGINTDKCKIWAWNSTSLEEYCYQCEEDYWRNFLGKNCTKNNDDFSCSSNCSTCREKDSYNIDSIGGNSICQVCRNKFGFAVNANIYPEVCGVGAGTVFEAFDPTCMYYGITNTYTVANTTTDATAGGYCICPNGYKY